MSMNKKFLIVFIGGALISNKIDATKANELKFEKEEKIELTPKPIKKVGESKLIKAIIEVESNGNDSAYGDTHIKGGEAVGALQIRPIMVREVNRILKLKRSKLRYKLEDRWDRKKSIEMFQIWKEFHHEDDDFETIARNWNGGPNGYKKSRTEKYWLKVEAVLNN